jgi:GGDEF domain-containing protein
VLKRCHGLNRCRMVELHRELEGKNVKLEELASTDSLTGLPNRRAIEEWADKHA